MGGWVNLKARLSAVEKRRIFCLYRELNPDYLVLQPETYSLCGLTDVN
jgi:hypothetical protein